MDEPWVKPETLPALAAGELQIWRIDLSSSYSSVLLAESLAALTVEERQRAARMRTGTAPEEFIASRGFLRRLLGAAFHCDPQGISIVSGPHRKPELRAIAGMQMPCFNVSHSRGMILIALSRAGSVGVDIEYIDRTVQAADIARASFHPDDVHLIERAASPRDRLLAFYRCWTRREAVAKADGRGLTLPAAGLRVGAGNEAESTVELVQSPSSEPAAARHYFVRGLAVGPCHRGAVAITQPGVSPTLLDPGHLVGRESSTQPFSQSAALPAIRFDAGGNWLQKHR